jgi:hypothetical protein
MAIMARTNRIVDPAKIGQVTFSSTAQVKRNSESGLDFAPAGALGTAVRVGPSTPVLCYNNSAAVAWVAFGSQAVAAPTGYANGLPIPANSMFVYNSGESEWIISNVATTFGYVPSGN